MPRPSRAVAGLVALTLASSLLAAVVATVEPDPALAATPGVDLGGDPTFDSNSIADAGPLQPRWNSYPGSRWTIGRDGGRPMDTRLQLDLNGYTNDAYRMSEQGGQTRGILTAAVATPGGTPALASADPATTWYPSQIQFTATYPGGDTVVGGDLFTGPDSTLRYLRLTAAQSRDLVVGGYIPSGMNAVWDAATSALYVQTATTNPAQMYVGYVLTFYQGTGNSPLTTTPTRITTAPSIGATTWHLAKNFEAGGGELYVSIGLWVLPETPADGLQRSTQPMNQPVFTTATSVKTVFDALLRSVPAPQSFGMTNVASPGPVGRAVTGSSQRSMYYRAWAFVVQQYIAPQDDWAANTWNQGTFSGPQMACGKPILKSDFNLGYPIMNASCPWDSLFGMQLLSYVPTMRQGAFDALQSMLDGVYRNGLFYGERLPSRFAQTAWIVYENVRSGSPQAAKDQLREIYPQLQAVLSHVINNPYWAESSYANTPSDERDIEYVSSMIFDLQFAKKIAAELGYPADVTAFQAHADAQLVNLRSWFFGDPGQDPDGTGIYTFSYADANKPNRHYSCDSNDFRPTNRFPAYSASDCRPVGRAWDVPISILTTLAVPDLPTDLRDRLIGYWFDGAEAADWISPAYSGVDPGVGGAGMGWTKYPDTSLMALGLLEKLDDPSTFQFIQAMARDAAYAPNFSEYLKPDDGLVANTGLTTTSFSAQQLIDFTLLMNGYSIGTPTASHAVPTS